VNPTIPVTAKTACGRAAAANQLVHVGQLYVVLWLLQRFVEQPVTKLLELTQHLAWHHELAA
jgi:hypothetical protein